MSAKTQEATEILRKDLESVEKLFSKYKNDMETGRKEDIVAKISLQLVNHMSIMEQVVVPETKETVEADKAAEQADEGNHVHVLLAQLQRMIGDDEGYDKQVKDLHKRNQRQADAERRKIIQYNRQIRC